jgi:hypothetical protein
MAYIIKNTEGRTGGAWVDEFATKGEAGLAIREEMGWDDIEWSDSFGDTYCGCDVTAWSVYPTTEARDADDNGAYAPRVIRLP